MKRFAISLLLVVLGAAAGYGWFRFGPAFESAFVPPAPEEFRSAVALPRPDPPFGGVIGKTYRQSRPDYAAPPGAPPNAPNVLLILTDDVGFAASSTFGGPVPTPNLDRLAAGGLIYNRFHTTAMCSPTRAAMLTGRNAHMAGSGAITNLATGYPGYTGRIPRSAATVGRILTGNGYNSAFFGKHHNVPEDQASAAGPFDLWPTGLGFEFFFGFIGGDTDQFRPKLYRGIQAVDSPQRGDPDYILDRDLADEAIRWLRNQQAAAPDKPFLIWYAPGTTHAPHQAPREWIEKFRGRFGMGWDRLREQSYARQMAGGLIPRQASLTPRPDIFAAWDSLSDSERAINERFMEVFAATLAFQDAQIGRVLDELRRLDEFDNTMIMFVVGDNGASAEGALRGTLNEIGSLANDIEEPEAWFLDMLGEMGGPGSYQTYPAAWAWALDTPFQWTKAVGSHLGGIRNGLVVSWPAGIEDAGGIRSQFHHVIDILPTVLEAAGIEAPAIVDGIPQQRIEGVSMRYSFDGPEAPERRTTQYFELLGNRAIYHEGWMASTTPRVPPWSMEGPGGDPDGGYAWELYDLSNDYSQALDLADQMPDRLAELRALWWEEAVRNNVLPLDDRRGAARVAERWYAFFRQQDRFVYNGSDISLPFFSAPPLFARDFTIVADVTLDAGGSDGVLLAFGSWFGGWSFYLDGGVPVVHHAFSRRPEDQSEIRSAHALPAGDARLEFRFEYDGGGLGQGGTIRIFAGGGELAAGRVERQVTMVAGLGETLDIGRDTGVPVVQAPAGQTPFQGEIHQVEFTLGKLQMLPF